MNFHLVTCALLAGLGMAYGQQPELGMPTTNSTVSRPASPAEWRLQVVSRLISLPSPVATGASQLHAMGDEAAADIVKLLGNKKTLSAPEIYSILDVVHMAFEKPQAIAEAADHKPQAGLFLMQYLATTTNDAVVKGRIAAETTFLAAVKVPPAPVPSTSKQ